MLPWAHLSSYPKRHLDRFSCSCTPHGRRSLYFTTGRPFPLKIALANGGSGLLSNKCLLGPTPPTQHLKWHLNQFSRFLQLTAECPYSLHWATNSPFQNCPFTLGTCTPSNTRFLGDTRVHNPNGILISSAVLQGS